MKFVFTNVVIEFHLWYWVRK